MSDVLNIKVEPCTVTWNDVDLGLTDGDLEISPDENSVDITPHQEGTNILDSIRTGNKVELKVTLQETSLAQVQAALAYGGGSTGGVAEVTTVTCVADVSGSLNNKEFYIYGASGVGYAVWFNVNSAGTDPSIPGFTSVPVALATGATANAVGDAVASALDALADFTAPNPGANIVTVTNAAAGVRTAPDAGNSGFTLLVTVTGSSALTGWGKGKQFSSMYADSAKLVLHPLSKAVDNLTEDWAFWKAYPMVNSIKLSGEKPQTISVTFKIFHDASKADDINLYVIGDHS